MAITTTELHDLYLAYFGRPADVDGMIFYTANPAWTVQSAAAAFSASPESIALYGEGFGAAQVRTIYQTLFGRDAEVEGIQYWTREVASGRISPAFAAYAILLGAQHEDIAAVANKRTIVQAFFDALDTTGEIVGYSGADAAALARAFLETVTAAPNSLAEAQAGLDAAVAQASGQTPPIAPPPPPPPLPQPPAFPQADFEFTAGTDQLGDGEGPATDDIFGGVVGGANGTVADGDSAHGGAGEDTLQLEVLAAGALPGVTATAIEHILIRNSATGAVTVDASKFAGALYLASHSSRANVSYSNLADGQIGAVVNELGEVPASLTHAFRYSNEVAQARLELFDSDRESVILGGAGVTLCDITSSGEGINRLSTLTLEGAQNAETLLRTSAALDIASLHAAIAGTRISVEGTANLRIDTLNGNVIELDAGASTAGVNLNSAGNSVFVDGFTFIGSDTIDVFHTVGALTSGSIDGGGSSDTLVIRNSAHIASAQTGLLYTGFERVEVRDGVTQDFALLSEEVTSVEIQDGAGVTEVQNLGDTLLNSITVSGDSEAGAIKIGALDADGDTFAALRVEAGTKLGGLQMAGVEQVQLTADGGFSFNGLAGVSNLDQLFVQGQGDVSVTTGVVANSDVLFDFIDLAGEVTFDASAAGNQIVFLGSFTHSNHVTDSASNDDIEGGHLNDTVTYQGGADDVVLHQGGDTFDFGNKQGEQVMSETVLFTVEQGDSVIREGVEPLAPFAAAAFFDPNATDSFVNIANGAEYGATSGAAFRMVNISGTAAGEVGFGTELSFGATDYAVQGGFFLLDNSANEAGTAYLFHDADNSGVIDADDIMVRLVGAERFTVDEFTHQGGLLTFRSTELA